MTTEKQKKNLKDNWNYKKKKNFFLDIESKIYLERNHLYLPYVRHIKVYLFIFLILFFSYKCKWTRINKEVTKLWLVNNNSELNSEYFGAKWEQSIPVD